ncbi:NADH-cytochrome b5 reductase [Neophaeococcomyces mojaviensis]|uniref:NADH-cytochrome b5 reductase n=1 Tax=Neophaeococcomyces mojaviensis TaxID=3383035 RepID=A0ACC2ZZI7_9EURO|nr:NADH-cytochrome b5 reductase [Knufia sp. JES_112]
MSSQALSMQNIRGVYVPAVLLIIGVGIVKKEWIPFAAIAAAVLGGLQIYMSQPAKFLKPDTFQELPLTKIIKTSHNVKIYRFSLPSPNQVLGLPIGQHISIAATPKNADKEIVRSYTPISSDEDLGYVDFMIKSYPQGNISAHMDTLKEGDSMKFRGPKGAMVYTPNMCKHIGMIAGGTGITPMLQIIRAIERGRSAGDKTKVDLIFANVNPDDILLKDDIDEVARRDPNFKVYYVLNNPPPGWTGGVGFVTPDMIKEHLPAPGPDMKLLMCGPPPMISAMKKAAESLGYQKPRPVSKLDDQVFCF